MNRSLLGERPAENSPGRESPLRVKIKAVKPSNPAVREMLDHVAKELAREFFILSREPVLNGKGKNPGVVE
jgi:hypothetical protein